MTQSSDAGEDLEPATPQSRDEHYTSESLCSYIRSRDVDQTMYNPVWTLKNQRLGESSL